MKCKHNQWKCDNGQCIRFDKRCDGIYHCSDYSDETAKNCIHLYCPEYAFRCAYGGCITGSLKCNGYRDCADNSDESNFLCDKSLNYETISKHLSGNCR